MASFLNHAAAGLLGGVGADMHNKKLLRLQAEAERARMLREDNLARAKREQDLADEERRNKREDTKDQQRRRERLEDDSRKRRYDIEDRDIERSDISNFITTDEGVLGVNAKGEKVRIAGAQPRLTGGGGGGKTEKLDSKVPEWIENQFVSPVLDEDGKPVQGIDGGLEMAVDTRALNEFTKFASMSGATNWNDAYRAYIGEELPRRKRAEQEVEQQQIFSRIAGMSDAELKQLRGKIPEQDFSRIIAQLPEDTRKRLERAGATKDATGGTFVEREKAKYSAMSAEELAQNLNGKAAGYVDSVLQNYVDPQIAAAARKLLDEEEKKATDPSTSFRGAINNIGRNLRGLLE